ncbi:MAG TPA: choice-of-anchor D domain-containing protein [Bryobacteraceae bacterium]|nr:choice-of-anchor D domain-containing protein [Bryobacteraceae bacterium]
MIRGFPILLAALAVPFAAVTPALGQSVLQVSVTVGGTTSNVAPGGSQSLTASGLGQSVLANVTVKYTGATAATITGVNVTGTSDMTVSSTPAFPVALNPGGSTTFTVQYLSSSGNAVTGQVSIAFTENSQPSSFQFVLAGTAPNLSFTYFFVPNGALTDLIAGNRITFPSTNVGASATATVTILNRGTATGSLQSAAVSGASYQLVGSPAPAQVQPGQQASFNVVFTPQATGSGVGLLTLTLNTGSVTFPLAGTGTAPGFTVSYTLADGNVHPLPDGTLITFPAIDINATSTATINILNQGTGSGTVNGITLTASGFRLTGLPLLPATVGPGQTLALGIVFAPTQAGSFSGSFRIDFADHSVSGTLAASTNLPNLAVSYTLADGNVHPLSDGALITFPAIDINTTSTATINILNQGTGAAIVTNIAVSGTGFTLTGSPLLPATVPAGQSVHFGIVFNTTQTGSFNGTFRIDLAGRSISGILVASTTQPGFAVSYTLADGIVHPFSDGGAISFPSVDVNATSTATISVVNQGTGAGSVTGVFLAGTGFRLSGVPALPATIAAGQSLQFGIIFAPSQSGSFAGSFRIDLTGRSISGTIAGSTSLPNFTVAYSLADNITHPLPDGTTLTFPSVDINATTTATIGILNQGTGSGTVNAVTVSGTGFRLTGLPLLPATVAPGQALTFGIVFAPSQSGSFAGSFRIDLVSRSISGSLVGSTAASSIALAYVDPVTSSILPLQNGSTLSFPNTLTTAVSNITLLATNNGTGTGFLNSIALAGSSPSTFQLLNLPSFPAAVPPSLQGKFGIRFSPQQQQVFSATLLLDVSGQSITINLLGQGIGPQYTYTSSDGTNTAGLLPGGTAAFADTVVGQVSGLTISILNAGAGDGQIAAVSVSGQGFALADLPPVPFTVAANASQRFTLNFSPTQPGAVSGRLTIGNDTFTVTGTAIGSRLIYSYVNAAAATAVTDGGVVILTPAAVGSSGSVGFSVQNTGTSAATISSINLAAPSTVFALQNLPALPLNLDPGATSTFQVGFTPNNTGTLTATLRINNSSFTLSGTGTAPTPLPSYQFQGPAGNQQPAQQMAVGLSLASSYPLPVQGTLTLTFVPSVFADDPAIQFASGGRTVKFSIAANSTQALFNGSATSIPLQTGTTAGDIVITPSFTIQDGFDVTPSSPAALTLTIPRSAPQLLSGNVTAETLTTFTLTLSGYSTTRSLTKFDVQITPKQGQSFATTHLTFDVSSASASWFQGTASQGFGGAFSVEVPFVLQNGSTTNDLVHLLQSLSITATNEVGASTAISVPIP